MEKPKPPALAHWLLTKILDEFYLEEFLGDLDEMFDERAATRTLFVAQFLYWIDAFHLIIGFSTSRVTKTAPDTMMLRNLLTMAWRNAVRQKQFTFLNIFGLTLGVATCVTIGLYVYDELTYDTFHAKGDRIYRINQPLIWGNWDVPFSSTGPNVAEALRTDAPEFEQVTRIMADGEQTIRITTGQDAMLLTEKRYFLAEENFFDVFSFEFISGDPKTALKEPMSLAITQSTAKRFFGDADPINKMIEVKQKDGTWSTYTVRALLKDVPSKSHLQFDVLASLSSYSEMMKAHGWKWIFTSFSTYGLVREGTNVANLEMKIQSIPPKWAEATTTRIFNQTLTEFTGGKPWRLYMQPLRDVYLGLPDYHRFGPSGNPQFVYIFGGIGVLVLVLSCINFMNLSTARSSIRAKEVGVRKVLGSQRYALVKQFIVESVLYAAVSTWLALLLVQLSTPLFNSVAGKNISLFSHLSNPIFLGGVAVFILLIGLAAGSYPAFYLSSFSPSQTLKGKITGGFRKKGIRNSLVVFQFTVSIALIICTFFVQKQLNHTATMDVGFNRNNILQIHKIEQIGTSREVIKEKLAKHPAFQQVAFSHSVPPFISEGERYKADHPEATIVDINNIRVDDHYLELLGVEFLAGRNFDESRQTDRHGIILNEEAARVLGLGTRDSYTADSPVGKYVVQAFDKEEKLEVIGVVKNFNYIELRDRIEPLMIVHYENDLFWNYGLGALHLSARINPQVVQNTSDLQSILEDVESELHKIDSSVPFQYSFLDEGFENAFRSEQRMSTILNLFTFLAVIIACLGLYGLAAFSAEQRTKELGIRKVLGAKVHELVFVFSSEFTKLVGLSIMIASPVAYYLVNKWLSGFSFRTSIDVWVFAAAAMSALVIAWITISYQSFSAARRNPAETLKSE